MTGASRGVGRAIAVELGRRGASVVCAARASAANPLRLPGTVDETARAVDEAGGAGLAVPCDLTSDDDIARLFDVTLERFGRLDMLVNNAAVSFGGDLDIAMKRFDVLMRINVRAPLVATRLAQPHLAAAPGGGRILNVGSVTATGYFPTMMTYGMSKAALEHLTVTFRGGSPGGQHRRQLLPHRRAGGLGGLRDERPRRRPLRLGGHRHRGRRRRLDAGPAGGLDGAGGPDAGAGIPRAVHRRAGPGTLHPHRPLDDRRRNPPTARPLMEVDISPSIL